MSVSSFFLKIDTSLAIFHDGKITPRSRVTRARTTAVPAAFKSFGGILLGPVDLFVFEQFDFFANCSLRYCDFHKGVMIRLSGYALFRPIPGPR